MRVTGKWIHENTLRGITKRQMEILGATFPLKKGWLYWAIGSEISAADAQLFEELGKKPVQSDLFE